MNTSEEAITRLASRLSAGDHDALRECYQLWGAGVYTYAYRRLGSPQDAEDVTQQVFVAAWRNRSQLVPSEVALPAWLLGIARNKVADQLRAAARQTAQAKLAPLPATSAEPHESLLDRLVILDALNTLEPPRDEIIRLLFLQDKTIRRVGASHASKQKLDVKVVVATHLDLAEEVKANRFRFDLYMRLRPATQIKLPALAERRSDLPNLIVHLTKRLLGSEDFQPLLAMHARRAKCSEDVSVTLGKSRVSLGRGLSIRFADATVAALEAYAWPGNTRELESLLDTLMIKAIGNAQQTFNPTPILEIDHAFALSLLPERQSLVSLKNPTIIADVAGEATDASSTAGSDRDSSLNHAVFSFFSHPNARYASLSDFRRSLERAFLLRGLEECEADVTKLAALIFESTKSSDITRLKQRFNQLGIKLVEEKRRLRGEK